MEPVKGMKLWPESNYRVIEPPEVKKLPSRPKKCKRRDKDEPKKAKFRKSLRT